MEKEAVTIGAAKVLRTSVSFTGNVEGVSSQIVIANPAANVAITQFTQDDFKTALLKVSQRRMSKTYVKQLRARFPQPPATDDPATYEFETHQD